MKIAICFYGLHPVECWKGIKNRKDVSHLLWKKNVFNYNDNIDIFMHSWSTNRESQLIKEYNPLKYKIEKQKDFSHKSYLKSKTEEHLLNKSYNLSWGEIQYSVSYSMKQSVMLKKEYESNNNFTYDYVMLARMDLAWLVPLEFKTLNTNKFYNPIWGKNNIHIINSNYKSLLGNWFISNSNNIDKFSLLYDNLDKYIGNKFVSMHNVYKIHLDSFLSNEMIEYKYTDHTNKIIACDKQRFLTDKQLIL